MKALKNPSKALWLGSVLSLLVTLATGTRARVDLTGQTLTATDPGAQPPSTRTVDPVAYFDGDGGTLGFALGADTLTITNLYNLNNGWEDFGAYTLSGFTVDLTSITVASNVGFSGSVLDPTIVDNTIQFNFNPFSDADNGSATLVFAINSTPAVSSSVPDGGSTLALLGLALRGGVAVRKGKRRRAGQAC